MFKHNVARLGLLFAATFAVSQGAALTVQPIQVCDDAGNSCANSGRELFEDFTDAIWMQAGIDVTFLPWNTFNSTNYLNLADVNELIALWSEPASVNQAHTSDTVISMWFVDTAFGNYGVAQYAPDPFVTANRIAIANNVFSYNNPNYTGAPGEVNGRPDTIAHEIGHNLGLDHCTDPCSTSLMASGGGRQVAASLSQIGTFDQLSSVEIGIASQSPLLSDTPTPEPSSLAMGLTGIGMVLVGIRYRKNRS